MSDLDRLFYWRGVSSDYYNYGGEHVVVPEEDRLKLLSAMGVDLSSDAAVTREADKLDIAAWTSWLPALFVSHGEGQAYVDICLSTDDVDGMFPWRVSDLDGGDVAFGDVNCASNEEVGKYDNERGSFTRRRIYLGELQPNYYRLQIQSKSKTESTLLAVCPEQTYRPEWSLASQNTWGVLVQLYTLRSKRNWGIGDFSDLRALISSLSDAGADFVGLNPLHALLPDLGEHFSPYCPSDRRFITPLYVDPLWLTDVAEAVKSQINVDLLKRLREAPLVDYEAVRNVKYPVFETLFDTFLVNEFSRRTHRWARFRSYVVKGGPALFEFARFESSHQQWAGQRYVASDCIKQNTNVDSFFQLLDRDGERDGEECLDLAPDVLCILFHCYLQWIAQDQLLACQQHSKTLGMRVGLIRDLAVGAEGGGSEVQSNQLLFCRGASIGAPPDPFAHQGQNWGLPPMIPSELRASGYEHFIELLRANMKHCGALRIDHAMSLMRLWWCPPDETADHGAYVYYPFPELLGLLTLESHLNRCLIVGEDLGVVPDEFREALARVRAFSNKVFYFEKDYQECVKPPSDYAVEALAMVNNHDVPTLVSWWNGTDLVLRDKLNILEAGTDYAQVCAARHRDKSLLLTALYDAGCYPDNWHGRPADHVADEELIEAILLFVSKTASKLFVFQLEDLLMMDQPVNIPGTFKEHENWKRKLTKPLEAIFSDKWVLALLDKINAERRR